MQETHENQMGDDRKVKYDLMFILSPLLHEDKALEESDRLRKIIETHGGSVFETELPKLRPLAYEVTKTWEGKKSMFDQGLFGTFKFEVVSTELPAIQEEFRAMQHLLRSAVTYAYLDVRPVRRIPGTEEKPLDEAVPVNTVDTVSLPLAARPSEVGQDAPEPIKKPMSEAEIDKQIEDLLS